MTSVAISDDLLIRAATNDDRERIELLVFSVLEEYGLKPDPDGKDADLNDIEANYFKRGGCFEVIEDGEGNLIGSIGIYPVELHTCELRKMYFAPSLRGKGFGRKVLETTIKQAKSLGFARMTLETVSVLKEAIRLYERFGFRPCQPKQLSGRCDSAYVLEL
jgi:putative acetyltransferase